MNKKIMPPVHPGELLLKHFLKPMGMSAAELADSLRMPARRIHEVIRGKRSINAEAALRLGRFFGTTAQFWMNLQSHYDLEAAEDRLGDRVHREVTKTAKHLVKTA